jgi:hypothetical protein
MIRRERIFILQRFLSVADANRALQTFRKLVRHEIQGWALTGGLAVEVHRLSHGCQPSMRALNDIAFIAESFDAIPETLADDFLFRHIHPRDPVSLREPGWTYGQAKGSDVGELSGDAE